MGVFKEAEGMNMGKWANKIVTKRDAKYGWAIEHHWACSVCGKEYEKQSDAWECCGDKKKLPWRTDIRNSDSLKVEGTT